MKFDYCQKSQVIHTDETPILAFELDSDGIHGRPVRVVDFPWDQVERNLRSNFEAYANLHALKQVRERNSRVST